MITLYTENFGEFLTKYETSEEWQAIKNKFDKFPDFNLFDDVTFKFNMYDLFKDKYDIFEIGCETEEIFIHEVNDILNELLIKYAPKIKLYIENFSESMSRKVKLSQDGTTTNYLYPISTANGKVANEIKYNGNKENMLMIFRSNAELLNKAFEIRDIYIDCLNGFSKCFMGIY